MRREQFRHNMGRASTARLSDLPVLTLDNQAVVPPKPPEPHTPLRPMWCCRACADPWPCATARLLLKAEYDADPVGLSVHLCGVLHEAARDLFRLNPHNAPTPREMFERFVAWGPHRRPLITCSPGRRGRGRRRRRSSRSVVEEHHVEPAQPFRVGEEVDRHDPALADGEAEGDPRLAVLDPRRSHRAVQQRQLRRLGPPREGVGHRARAADLARRADLHGLLGVEPIMDEAYYVQFNVDGQEVGLDPHGHSKGMTGPVGYWHVDDIEARVKLPVDAGAEVQQPINDVGGGRLIATVKDADGNVIGLLQPA
jgi:predicted enzyme related to lactoylglutathione lyase